MKLKKFDLNTLPKLMGAGKKVSRIAFGKAGTIHFNPSACVLIGLTTETKVSLSQDEEEPDNWYVYIDVENGFPLRLGYDKKGCLFNHITLVKEVIAYFKIPEDKSHGFLVAGQPTMIKGDKTKYWGLISPVKN